jgi:hypothetical protein
MCSVVQQSSEKEYFTAPTAGTDGTGSLLQQNQGEDFGSVEQVGQGRGSVHEIHQEEVSKAQVRVNSLLPGSISLNSSKSSVSVIIAVACW